MMDRFDMTDGWHPTVNPSARMPVHHFQFIETLGHCDGVLNEFPRRRGGSTLRLIRFTDYGIRVVDLPGTLEWPTWWLPTSDPRAVGSVSGIYRRAIQHEMCTQTERDTFERTLSLFEATCAHPTLITVGEALEIVMDILTSELIPTLPRLNLVSLTRSSLRSILAHSLMTIHGGLADAFGRFADLSGAPMWPLVAVATDRNGIAQRVRFHTARRQFDTGPLLADSLQPGRMNTLSTDQLVGLLAEGRLVLGARLLALAEANLAGQGVAVRHYGNTYGHTVMAGHAISVPAAASIPCHADDADSWHYAVLQISTGSQHRAYPLHLMDVLSCGPEARAVVSDFVAESMRLKAPVKLEPRKSLDATLLAGRAGLLGQEDGGLVGSARPPRAGN